MQTNIALMVLTIFFVVLILSVVFFSANFANYIGKESKIPMKKWSLSAVMNRILHKKESLKIQKGFTIIELIVVVAIIAVLAAVVLVNVTGYINKGKDAAIKGNLAAMITRAVTYFEANGNYGADSTHNWCTTGQAPGSLYWAIVKTSVDNAYGAGSTTTCVACDVISGSCSTGPAIQWCATALLKNGNKFCVDSAGVKKEAAAQACSAFGLCL
jgi:prepilin-type N-terminal cleavage/methylation domain-containing protein